MLRVLWVFLVIPVLAMPALAAPAPTPPAPVPHGQYANLSTATVAKVDRDTQTITWTYTVTVPVNVTEMRAVERIIEVQGMKRSVIEMVPVTVTRMVVQERATVWSAKENKAIDALGKPLSWDELIRRIQPNSAVLTGSGSAVDPRYLRLFKPDTVILLAPDQGSTPIPVPVPLPEGVPVPLPMPIPEKR